MKFPVSLPAKLLTELNMGAVLGILKNQSSFVLTHAEKRNIFHGDEVTSCYIHFTREGISAMFKNQ